MFENLRIFRLLLSKSFLVRKRKWKSGLFGEVTFIILMFFCIFSAVILSALPLGAALAEMFLHFIQFFKSLNTEIYNEEKANIPSGDKLLFVTPDSEYVKNFMKEVQTCFGLSPSESTSSYKTEKEMLEAMRSNKSNANYTKLAVVFNTDSFDSFTKYLDYKILTEELPPLITKSYSNITNIIAGFQICLDQNFIATSLNSSANIYKNTSTEIFLQRMPSANIDENFELLPEGVILFVKFYYGLFVISFMIPLYIEASYVAKEKFLGLNFLMATNGVPNYINLLSWLISGGICSLIYIFPMSMFFYFAGDIYFLNGIFFLLNIAHLVTFGMHVLAYFRRSSTFVIGLLMIYVGSSALLTALYVTNGDSCSKVPFSDIIFPNFLLYHGFAELLFCRITKGRFKETIFLYSILGIIFHFLMAVYISSINPGKYYGTKKHPLYFLKIFKKTRDKVDYNAIENLGTDNSANIPLESLTEDIYTPGIQIRDLEKLYKKSKVPALKGISVDFYKGQITVLLGQSGAGKSTVMSILTGMIDFTKGLVLINGKNIKTKSDEILRDVGFCTQNQKNMFFPHLSVAEQLTLVAKLKKIQKLGYEIKTETHVTKYLERLNLFEKRDFLPKTLSNDELRRLCLGMAMIGDSSVLILDEPTFGLNSESKQIVWNTLLKIRKKKTIIISTNDMEEADILGDRIAILHNGKLKAYGTADYLKKLMGDGNIEVTLSTACSFAPENVLNHLDPRSEVVYTADSKTVLSVPKTPELPDSLDEIENNIEELGITEMSVSEITLENAFLKLTKDEDDESELSKPSVDNVKKWKDDEQPRHSTKALLYKKLMYIRKTINTTLTMLSLLLIAIICMSVALTDPSSRVSSLINRDQYPIALKLDTYDDPEVYYQNDNQSAAFARNYEAISKEHYGTATVLTNMSDLYTLVRKDPFVYDRRALAGARFRTGPNDSLLSTAFYNSDRASLALPISINLLTNTLLRTMLGPDYAISASVQQLQPSKPDVFHNLKKNTFHYEVESSVVFLIFVCLLYPAVGLFVVHPATENLTSVKHLQRMTGVSGFKYWGVIFLFDFLLLTGMLLIFLVGLVIADAVLELKIFRETEIAILTSMFMLFAVHILPFIYCFSFLKKSANKVKTLLIILPLVIVPWSYFLSPILKQVIAIITTSHMEVPRRIGNDSNWQTNPVFPRMPYLSFLYGQVIFFKTAKVHADCERMSLLLEVCDHLPICCAMHCGNGVCESPRTYFYSSGQGMPFIDPSLNITLELIFTILGGTSVLYFAILYLLEYKVIRKSMWSSLWSSCRAKDSRPPLNEEMQKETNEISLEISKIKSHHDKKGKNESEETVAINGDAENNVIAAYRLQKLYSNFEAVQDLSFRVQEKQCFGLLGLSGAGKSVTLRMLSGQEIPDSGELYLGGNDLNKNQKMLSQIGYCPQNDALIKPLNAYDHLILFARLRGIREEKVNEEVQNWIDRLNLNDCALRPSGTYSNGNKRKLNVAMALIGSPKLVLMDEPTAGVDPATRRFLWNVIQSCQENGQTVLLSSNRIEECEALCNKLGIMDAGKLIHLGSVLDFKHRVGAGNNIQIKLNPEKYEYQVHSIKIDLQEALDCKRMSVMNSRYLLYHVTSTKVTWRKMYDVMNDLKNKYDGIENFSILSTSLEDRFQFFIAGAED